MPRKQPAQRRAKLTHDAHNIWIMGVTPKGDDIAIYAIVTVTTEPEPSYKLVKYDGTKYTVAVHKGRASCTCEAYEYSRQMNKSCKHIWAMREVGMLKAKE